MSLRELVAAFYAWCYHSPALSILRDTKLGVPAVQTVHLIGITIVLGTAVTMNLRYLNLGYRDLDARSFLSSLWTWFRRGLLLTVVAGFVVFLPDPARYVENTSFRVKMAVLTVAILYQFTVFRRATRSIPTSGRTPKMIAIAAITLMLWFGVGWCGRAIAFIG